MIPCANSCPRFSVLQHTSELKAMNIDRSIYDTAPRPRGNFEVILSQTSDVMPLLSAHTCQPTDSQLNPIRRLISLSAPLRLQPNTPSQLLWPESKCFHQLLSELQLDMSTSVPQQRPNYMKIHQHQHPAPCYFSFSRIPVHPRRNTQSRGKQDLSATTGTSTSQLSSATDVRLS